MKPLNPLGYWANALEFGQMMAEAQSVIAMRTMGMAGMWSVTKSEDGRMISEKVEALSRAGTDATRAALRGATPDQIAAAALKPLRQKTRANARRLGKRGLKRK